MIFCRKALTRGQYWIYETNPGHVARGRCFVSNDALDACFARPRNSIGDIGAEGAFQFLRSILAAALCFSASSRPRFARSTRSGPGILRSLARTQHVESCGSGEGQAAYVLVGIPPEFSV